MFYFRFFPCSWVRIPTLRTPNLIPNIHPAYIVQGHRFDIIQEIGCHPNVYNTLLSYFLVTAWPVVFGLISFVYCGMFQLATLVSPADMLLVLTLRSFLQRQAQFTQFLASNKSLSASRYFRLMALACVEMMCTVPLSIVFTVLNLKAQPYNAWISWEDTHFNFSRVLMITSVIWRQSKLLEVSIECGRWTAPFCAFAFFAFFGFADESRKNYKKAIMTVLVVCRLAREDSEPLSTRPTTSSKYVRLHCRYPLRNLTLFPQASSTCAPLLRKDISIIFARVHLPSSAVSAITPSFIIDFSR